MNTVSLGRHFARMGARLKVIEQKPREQRRVTGFAVDVQRDRDGEFFEVRLPSGDSVISEIAVLQTAVADRHLLLMVRNEARKDRFLCGHDEREWFVAAVPAAVSTVAAAKEALKPSAVRIAQARAGVDRRKGQLRKNRAFLRQGEWFFLPVQGRVIPPERVLRNEPIARSGGKPHWVAELVREGGEPVYVSSRHPEGVSPAAYAKVLQRQPEAAAWNWRLQRRNMRVFARGTVRHPDHRTITLHDWHEVLMNTENQSAAMKHVAFID